jgi:hypothetical protein
VGARAGLAVPLDLVLDPRSLGEAVVPRSGDRAVLDEHVLAAIVPRDEAGALLGAEPPHGSGCRGSPTSRPRHERAAAGAKPRPALARTHVLTATVAASRVSDPRRSNAPAPGDLPRRRRPPGGSGADPCRRFPRGPRPRHRGSPRTPAGELARPRGAPVAVAALPRKARGCSRASQIPHPTRSAPSLPAVRAAAARSAAG